MKDRSQVNGWCRVGLQIIRLSHVKLSWTIPQILHLLNLSHDQLEEVINGLVLCGAPLMTTDDGISFQTEVAICNHDQVMRSLSLQAANFHSFWQISSTQDYCLSLDDDSNVEFCLAEHQLLGRGRRSKKWQTSFAAGVLFSYRKFLPSGFSVTSYSLMLSLEIIEQLKKRFPHLEIGVKWPNDIWLNGKKLLGILVDSVPIGEQVLMVVGVGCNFLCDDSSLVDNISGLHAEFCFLDKTELVILLMQACRLAVRRLQEKDFVHYCSQYNKRHIFHGRLIQFIQDSHQCYGVIKGVSNCGALQLQTAEGCTELASASSIVNLRPVSDSI